MRKLFLTLWSLFLILSALPVDAQVQVLSEFPDVPQTHVHAPAIQWIKDHGIVNGYEDGSFAPDNTISRAEFTKILIKTMYDAKAISGCETTRKFPDVVVGSWEEAYICVAYESGAINGFEDGSFRPWAPVSIHEAYKILAGAFGWQPEEMSDPWWDAYQDLFDGEGKPSEIRTVGDKLTRGGMAELLYSYNRNRDTGEIVWKGKFITFKILDIELLAAYDGAEKVTLTQYPDEGVKLEVSGMLNGAPTVAFQEMFAMDGHDGLLLGWVDDGSGHKAVAVISTYSGAGTTTSWFLLAESDGAIVKLDSTPVKQIVLDEYGYADKGYNAVSVIGDEIVESVPGNTKDDPTLRLVYRFTGEEVEVLNAEVMAVNGGSGEE